MRVLALQRQVGASSLPTFDGPRFAVWLRRWCEAEGLTFTEVARRSGLSRGMVTQLARGTQRAGLHGRNGARIDPAASTLAKLAHGLGMDFVYVASKAGLDRDHSRWASFSRHEREILLQA